MRVAIMQMRGLFLSHERVIVLECEINENNSSPLILEQFIVKVFEEVQFNCGGVRCGKRSLR